MIILQDYPWSVHNVNIWYVSYTILIKAALNGPQDLSQDEEVLFAIDSECICLYIHYNSSDNKFSALLLRAAQSHADAHLLSDAVSEVI